MKTKLLLTLILLLTDVPAFASAKKSYQAEYDSGIACVEKRNWKEAKVHFKLATIVDPQRGSGWLQLARTCEKTNDRTTALEAYKKCTALKTVTPGRYLAYSLCLLREGRRGAAQETMDKAFAKHKEWNAWGDIAFLKDELTELRTICSGDYNRLTSLGEAMLRAYNLESAENCFQEAIILSPQAVEAKTKLAITSFELGKKTRAERIAQTVLKKNPKNKEMLFVMAYIRGTQSKREESIRYYKQFLAIEPTNSLAWNNLGVTQTELGQLKDAESSLKQAIKYAPDHYINWWSMAELKKKTGNNQEAATLARKALSMAPNNDARLLFSLADLMESAHDIEGARQARARGLKADPEGAEAVMYVPYFRESQQSAPKED